MRSSKWSAIAFLIIALALLTTAGAYKTSIDGGGSVSTTSGASSGILFADAAGATAVGSGVGDFSGNWWVKNSAGMYAEVGMHILNSESYSYDYTLNPGEGGGWPASDYPEVSASESLDVNNANYIKAYAIARSAKKFDAIASTEISDSGKKASLLDYTNEALANTNGVSVSQRTEWYSQSSGEIFKCEANAIRRTPDMAKATATLIVSQAESLQFTQTATADTSGAQASNKLSLIGVGEASVSAKDGTGKKANSVANYFEGVFQVEQLASVDSSTANAWQSMKGVGYFTGGETSAKDGKKKAIVTQIGAHSGNVITNKQSASTDPTGSIASQEIELEYMPVSGWTGTYDQPIDLVVSSVAKAFEKVDRITEAVSGEFAWKSWEVSAP